MELKRCGIANGLFHAAAAAGLRPRPAPDIGIAPGDNINYVTSHASFKAQYETAPQYVDSVDSDVVTLGSVSFLVRSASSACCYSSYSRPGYPVINGLYGAFGAKTITYDFHHSMEGAKLVSCSQVCDPSQ